MGECDGGCEEAGDGGVRVTVSVGNQSGGEGVEKGWGCAHGRAGEVGHGGVGEPERKERVCMKRGVN